MNRLIKAINILHAQLNENNGPNHFSKDNSSIILSEKNNNLHTLFGYYDSNKCVLCCGRCEKYNTNNRHICKLYNLQKNTKYCKACNNNKHYLINLRKIAYLKKNNDNKLCINLRKQFEKISSLEKLYRTEIENISNFKESLQTNPCIYYDAKTKLTNYNKKKKKIQKQIVLEENKLINRRYNYIILFREIDV